MAGSRVGHNSAEQFTFHWWDHIFNKTASNITVETGEDGVQMKRVTEDGAQISNKKPRKGANARTMLYGRFVKAATLMSGGEMPAERSESSQSSEDEEEKLDLSSANKLTDEELMRACGGRTAHKGARHGLCMSAKLARLEEQERAFLAKYGKTRQTGEDSGKQEEERCGAEEKSGKKRKGKKSKRQADHALESAEEREYRRHKKQRKEVAAQRRNEAEGHEGQSKAACREGVEEKKGPELPEEQERSKPERGSRSKKKKKKKQYQE
ncbi:G patch domain-containing protein 4 isoform X2 [Rhinatrema bivittatum]|uniref:G patch domain-containing protein 4 isoform X2 n=1 Tax=Rhinatrema bivittatum TaxID=194408 RepID=UPI00112850DE|nr:G patch domain-containing protein 4 isoform X2 [Rhinatrema bivittatum]